MQGEKAQPSRSIVPPYKNNPESIEQKGNLLIRDLYQNGTNSVHYMRVMNTDTKSHLSKTTYKCLQGADRGKKKMYLGACIQKCRHFLTLVGEILGIEVGATLKSIASHLETK